MKMNNKLIKACVPGNGYIINTERYGTELQSHRDKCNKNFYEIEKGAPLYISVERVVSEDGFGDSHLEKPTLWDRQYIRVSLLTEEIIEYDFEMFAKEDRTELLNKYRPYFVSFIVPLEDNSIQEIESLGVDWHEGRFLNIGDAVSEKGSFEEGILLRGMLENSASPVNYLEGRLLVFTNRAMNKSVLVQTWLFVF